ncbi:MAG TPA: RNA methyltransferase [Verrucomicrobiae bacterium]
MLRLHRITTLDAPGLAPYRTLRQTAEHRRSGIFVAEGDKVVRRMFAAGLPVVSLLMSEDWEAEFVPLATARPEPIDVYLAPKKVLEQLTGFPLFQGLLGVGRIPAAPSLDELLATAASPRLLVALDGLANSENVGGLVRTAAAFGADGIIVGETCASPWLRRSVRNSMGAIFRLPALESPNLVRSLKELRARGVHCLAAHPHTDQHRLSQTDLTRDCCLVFGSEGHGISEAVLAACEEHVVIPMPADVDSLNVASASAAFLYEAARQRGRV